MGWREQIIRPALGLTVGGFRPTNNPLASCFGEIRVEAKEEAWPTFESEPLWPLCQLNLSEAQFKPPSLSDLAMICIFVSGKRLPLNDNVIDVTNLSRDSSWYLRAYKTTENLVPAKPPKHKSILRPFEAVWDIDAQGDYPNHDTMPIDFSALGIGDYYEQEGIEGIDRTKLGGWPSCIQSEPWWNYAPEGREFDYVMQIAEEPKSHWHLGGGFGYVARSRENPNRWAIDFQFY